MEACNGCTHIIHLASPVPGDEKERVMNENQMVNQASIGMISILHACQKYRVKKLIVCSSGSNIIGTAWKRKNNENLYDEKDYTVDHQWDELDGYMKSKIRQEEEIRQWVKENNVTTEIVTLHPTFTVGPTLTKYKTSNIEAFRKIISGEIPAVPELQLLSVDVRDVA